MSPEYMAWGGFSLFILLMLALDLGVFHRHSHTVGLREALVWSGVWVLLALAFNVIILWYRGPQAGLEFLAGYLVEKSLSVDNIFVFVMLFSYFHVPAAYQHKLLFWGVFGALLMRAGFIFAGVELLKHFHAIIYVFGAILIASGIKMVRAKGQTIHPERNPVLWLFRKLMPVAPQYAGDRFFTRIDQRWAATPLFVVLILVETTDLIFAVDSIPAILSISQDTFIVFTSNVFAILGLRSLYFALAGLAEQLKYLHYGLAAILVFVGCKMLLTDVYKIPVAASLGVIALVLTTSVAASLLVRSRPEDSPVQVATEPA